MIGAMDFGDVPMLSHLSCEVLGEIHGLEEHLSQISDLEDYLKKSHEFHDSAPILVDNLHG